MRLTNEQLVEKLMSVDINANDLVAYLTVSAKLLKSYGKAIYTEMYAKTIEKSEPILWSMIMTLKMSQKDHPEDIKNIIRLIKDKAQDYNPQFIVKTDSEDHYNQIQSYLDANFNKSDITKHTSR